MNLPSLTGSPLVGCQQHPHHLLQGLIRGCPVQLQHLPGLEGHEAARLPRAAEHPLVDGEGQRVLLHQLARAAEDPEAVGGTTSEGPRRPAAARRPCWRAAQEWRKGGWGEAVGGENESSELLAAAAAEIEGESPQAAALAAAVAHEGVTRMPAAVACPPAAAAHPSSSSRFSFWWKTAETAEAPSSSRRVSKLFGRLSSAFFVNGIRTTRRARPCVMSETHACSRHLRNAANGSTRSHHKKGPLWQRRDKCGSEATPRHPAGGFEKAGTHSVPHVSVRIYCRQSQEDRLDVVGRGLEGRRALDQLAELVHHRLGGGARLLLLLLRRLGAVMGER